MPAASREAASKESREAVELLERLQLKLFDPPPATPEAEAAALLLYLGLPTTAIFGRVIEDLGQWVVWSWGPYPSKRALIPSSRAQRLASLRDALKERHKSDIALLRSLQMQTKKKGIWWYDVRLLWRAYLGQGSPARLERLKEQLMEERHPSPDSLQKDSGAPEASTLPPPPRSPAEGELNQPRQRAKLEELVEALEEKKKNAPAGTAKFYNTLTSLLRQYMRERPEGNAEGFLAWLERQSWSRNSVRTIAYFLRAAGARDLKVPSISPAAREALTAEELQKLLEAARGEGFCTYALIALLGLCGLKVAEALSLTWGDIDFASGALTVRAGGRVRKVPAPKELLSYLAGYKGGPEKRVIPRSYLWARETVGRLSEKALGKRVTPSALQLCAPIRRGRGEGELERDLETRQTKR